MWITRILCAGILKDRCNSPHQFRHGHAVYALKNAKDVSALKAVSQNLMHENLSITDGVYGILSERDVREEIVSLGKKVESGEYGDLAALGLLMEQLQAAIVRIKKQPESR
jgi:integrase